LREGAAIAVGEWPLEELPLIASSLSMAPKCLISPCLPQNRVMWV